jgi:hypothetical protein
MKYLYGTALRHLNLFAHGESIGQQAMVDDQRKTLGG